MIFGIELPTAIDISSVVGPDSRWACSRRRS
jgi:hypothetical protein